VAVGIKDLNLPPPEVLAAAMVPILGTNSPYQAAVDIQRRGRASVYWPAGYRDPSPLGREGEGQVLNFVAALRRALKPDDPR
jgi:hypothetical protein